MHLIQIDGVYQTQHYVRRRLAVVITFLVRVGISIRRIAQISRLGVVLRFEIVAIVVRVLRIGVLSRLDECPILCVALMNNIENVIQEMLLEPLIVFQRMNP